MNKKTSKYILVVGGAGYIGAHMVWMLKDKGYKPVVLDNLSTGRRDFVPQGVPFIKGDLRKLRDIEKVFKKFKIDTVMHFAAAISVPESVSNPLKYYDNNVLGCINLLKVMQAHKVNKFIFSSTAAVYGEPKRIPIKETDPSEPKNPYGRSKLMIEQILKDLSNAEDFRYVAFRYFNAGGSHPSGKLGQWHPQATNLLPNIMRVLKGEQKEFLIFGDDYPSKDGTAIRDYIHVMDLCSAHLAALKKLTQGMKSEVFNLGSGRGFTVKEVVDSVEKVTKKRVNYRLVERRQGDPFKLIASSNKANKVLFWNPKYDLEVIVSTSWVWDSKRSG